jgi:hypothetical protein
MSQKFPSTWADYGAAVTRFIDAIDSLLEQGRVAQSRYDQIFRPLELRTGSRSDLPTEDMLPPGQQHIQRRLIQLTEDLYSTLLGPLPKQPAMLASSAARALGNRNRI